MSQDEDLLRTVRESPSEIEPRLVFADYLQQKGDPRGELIVRDLEGKTDDKGYKKLTSLMEKEFKEKFADHKDNLSLHPEWYCGFLKSVAITDPTPEVLDRLVSDYGAILQNLRVSFADDPFDEYLSPSDVVQHPIMRTLHSLIIDEEFLVNPRNRRLETKIDAPNLKKVRMDYANASTIGHCLRNDLLTSGTIEDLEFLNYDNTTPGRRINPINPILNLSRSTTTSLHKLGFVHCGVNDADIVALIDSLELPNLQALDLSSNEHLGQEELEYLLRHAPTALPKLREIIYTRNQLDVDDGNVLDRVVNLSERYNCRCTTALSPSNDHLREHSSLIVYVGYLRYPDEGIQEWEKTPLDEMYHSTEVIGGDTAEANNQQWPDDEMTRYDIPAVNEEDIAREEEPNRFTGLHIDDWELL